MSTVETHDSLEDHLRQTAPGEVSPEHDEWVKEEIQKRMKDKAEGKTRYTELERVREEFGL